MKIPAKSSANLSKTAKGVTSATHRPRQAFRPNARHDTIHKNISPEAGGFHPAAFCLLQRECIACISPTRAPQGKTALCNATHATKCNGCNESNAEMSSSPSCAGLLLAGDAWRRSHLSDATGSASGALCGVWVPGVRALSRSWGCTKAGPNCTTRKISVHNSTALAADK